MLEARVLRSVIAALARAEDVYREIVAAAMTLCQAHSAGVTVRCEDDPSRVRWPALSGKYAEHLAGSEDAVGTPCGQVLAGGGLRFLVHPERHFEALRRIGLPVVEALVIPVELHGEAVATLWVLLHEESRTFDGEDMRLLRQLADSLAVALALTREQQARREATNNARTLDALMEHIPEGITIAEGPDVVITRVSRYGQTLTGRPMSQISGIPAEQHSEHWEIYYPDGGMVPGDRLPLSRATRSGEVVRNEELSLRRPDGEAITILCNAGPIRADDGVITGGVIAWRDIDDVKAAERALQEYDGRKNRFIATLAHELRNPLAPIRAATRVLANAAATADQQKWSREVIDRQVATMARLLDDLLDMARINQGKLEIRREQTLLWSVLGSAIETAQPLIEARNHQLVVVLPEEPVRLEADPVRLCQVVSNLLNNAAKYTPEGGRIELTASVGEHEVRIVVADSGIGLSDSALVSIFETFSQVESSRSLSEGGLGVGLGLARGIVELHGGRIEVQSAGLGKGATFSVLLPRSTPPAASLSTGAEPDHENTPRRRVLLVDDNRDSADAFAMLLDLAGHEVRTAYSSDDALATLSEFSPEFALLDIGMPGMDGYELARTIRKLPLPTRPTLVAVTGWGQSDDKRRAREAGFDAHITKPVDPDHVFALMR